MAPGRSLLFEEIRDLLADAMIQRTKTKHEEAGVPFEPSWMMHREVRDAASDLAYVIWEKYFAPPVEPLDEN